MEPEIAQATIEASKLSLSSLFWQAHWFVKAIMILLIVMSVATWAIWLGKGKELKQANRKAKAYEEAFWQQKNMMELHKNLDTDLTDHPLAKVVNVGMNEWSRSTEDEKTGPIKINAINRARRLMDATMSRELEQLESGISFLATIGSTAPFIGLLGTVWGIMNAFQSIGALQNTSLAVVAPGIAEALLATALGLLAAIPAVIAYNRLAGGIGRYAGRIEAFASEFLSILERQEEEAKNKKKAA